MQRHERYNYPRGSHQRRGGGSFTSTSAPASITHDTTAHNTGTTETNTTTMTNHHHTNHLSIQRQREAHLHHALQHPPPTPAEVSVVASAAYVQALMELIDQHSADVEQMCNKIDHLQEQRETYHADLAKDALQRETVLQQLRNECADLSLQVQEERERSTRLLHETVVLHTQQAEAKEQLGRLAELCHARGKRLRAFYHHLKLSSGNGGGGGSGVNNLRSRLTQLMQEDGDCLGNDEKGASRAAIASVSGADVSFEDAALVGTSPSRVGGASFSPTTLPASLSIHKAACSRVTKSLFSNNVNGSSDGGVAMHDIGDDAELAAILNLPYKTLLPHCPSPISSPPAALPKELSTTAGTTAADDRPFTVTANAAVIPQLLALNEEVNMLRQQLEEQRSTYEQERGARTRADNEEHRRAQEQISRYAATVQQLESLHEESLRELVQYRHHTEKQLRDVRGQVEWLRAALQKALELAEKDRRQQHNEVYRTEQRMSRQYYPKVQSLHSELAEYRRTAAAQARDYAATLAKKDEQIEELQQRLKAETSQRHRVEERYRLEMEGVHSELDLMRQSLRQMERRVYYSNVRDEAAEEAELALEHYYR